MDTHDGEAWHVKDVPEGSVSTDVATVAKCGEFGVVSFECW